MRYGQTVRLFMLENWKIEIRIFTDPTYCRSIAECANEILFSQPVNIFIY